MNASVSAMLARFCALILTGFILTAAATPVKASARIAIIIDDIGYNLALGRRAAELPGAYTLALLPLTPHTQALAALGRKRGKELMLHAPMANERDLPLGPGALTAHMPRAELLHSLRTSLDSLPEVVGVNNHMGSALTAQAQPMGWVMGELSRRGLFFVDSRTTAATVAQQVALSYGIRSARRDVFLDHQRDPEHIRQQLAHALKVAQRQGWAIAIGHPYPETLAVLEQAESILADASVQLVKVSTLVRRSRDGRGDCPLAPILLRDYQAPNEPTKPQSLKAPRWPGGF